MSVGSTRRGLALFPTATAFQVTQEGLVVVRADRAPRWGRRGLAPCWATLPSGPVPPVDRPEDGVDHRCQEKEVHHEPDHPSRLSLAREALPGLHVAAVRSVRGDL